MHPHEGTSLVDLWLELMVPNAGGQSLILVREPDPNITETKIEDLCACN